MLGVLLAVSGIELAVAVRDMHEREDVTVMLIGAGCVLRIGTGGAFLLSSATALVFHLRRGAARAPSYLAQEQDDGKTGCAPASSGIRIGVSSTRRRCDMMLAAQKGVK